MMKKLLILGSLLLGVLLFAGNAEASLSSFWQEKNLPFIPCNIERKILAAEYGIWKYDCSVEKNNQLESVLRTVYDTEKVLGASVITGYRQNIAAPMTASQTSISVSSLLTKDNHTLTMIDLGSFVFLTLEPGGTKEEIVKCTGISGSSFTGCTRGLAFYGTSTAAVAANQKTHSAGSTIVMSNVHYVYEQYVDINDKDQSIEGSKIFSDAGGVCFLNSNLCIRGNGSNLQWSVNAFADSYNFTSSTFTVLTASSTKGILIENSQIGVTTTPTGGLTFDSTGSLKIKYTTNGGIGTDANGTFVERGDTFSWLAAHSFAVTTTMATTTMTSSTINNLNLKNGLTDVGTVTSTLYGLSVNGITSSAPTTTFYKDTVFIGNSNRFQGVYEGTTETGYSQYALCKATITRTGETCSWTASVWKTGANNHIQAMTCDAAGSAVHGTMTLNWSGGTLSAATDKGTGDSVSGATCYFYK